MRWGRGRGGGGVARATVSYAARAGDCRAAEADMHLELHRLRTFMDLTNGDAENVEMGEPGGRAASGARPAAAADALLAQWRRLAEAGFYVAGYRRAPVDGDGGGPPRKRAQVVHFECGVTLPLERALVSDPWALLAEFGFESAYARGLPCGNVAAPLSMTARAEVRVHPAISEIVHACPCPDPLTPLLSTVSADGLVAVWRAPFGVVRCRAPAAAIGCA